MSNLVRGPVSGPGAAEREAARLAALRSYGVLDTDPERSFDEVVELAALAFQAPMAMISLIDVDRQWFKSAIGTSSKQTDRRHSFCSEAIKGRDLMIVPDAQLDPRFKTNPYVTGDPNIRFYAGAPLVTADGHVLGTLCVIDKAPRSIRPDQARLLKTLADQVVHQLELRRSRADLAETDRRRMEAEEQRRRALDELKRLALVAQHTEDAVIITDRSARIEWCNEAFTKLSGYSLDEIRGWSPGSFLQGAETDQATVKMMRERQRQGIGFRAEVVNYRRLGGAYWVELEVEPVRDGTGELTHFIALQRDITGRKQKERRDVIRGECLRVLSGLDDVEETIPRLLDVIGRGMGLSWGEYWEVDESANVLRLACGWSSDPSKSPQNSSAPSAMLLGPGKGLPGEAWAGGQLVRHALIPKATSYGVLDSDQAVVREPSFAFPIIGRRGVMGVMRFFGTLIIEDDTHFVGLVGRLGRKIGGFLDRRQADKLLRDSEERSRVILETANDGIVILNVLGRIESVNASGLALFDCEADDLIGREIGSIIPGLSSFRMGLPHSSAGVEGEYNFRRADGLEMVVELTFSEFRLGGRTLYSCLVRDMTERMRADRRLNELERRYQAFFDQLPITAWICDREGMLLFRSAGRRLVDAPDLPANIGENLLDASPNAFSEAYAASIGRALDTGKEVQIISQAPRRDGTSGDFLIQTFPLPDEGIGRELVGSFLIPAAVDS